MHKVKSTCQYLKNCLDQWSHINCRYIRIQTRQCWALCNEELKTDNFVDWDNVECWKQYIHSWEWTTSISKNWLAKMTIFLLLLEYYKIMCIPFSHETARFICSKQLFKTNIFVSNVIVIPRGLIRYLWNACVACGIGQINDAYWLARWINGPHVTAIYILESTMWIRKHPSGSISAESFLHACVESGDREGSSGPVGI